METSVGIETSFEVNNCYVEIWHEDLLIKIEW